MAVQQNSVIDSEKMSLILETNRGLTPQKVLQQVFGYPKFRTGQALVIDAVLHGRDALVVMPTGGGKSLCYQIPTLCGDGVSIVISPLISLMKDQVDQLRSNGVAAAYLTSEQESEQQQQIWRSFQRGQLKLLYISPEKIATAEAQWQLRKSPLTFIAIDEAHCISQWGHDFRQDYRGLGSLKEWFPQIPLIALTATADQATRQDLLQHLNLIDPFVYVSTFDRPNIRYTVVEKLQPLSQIHDFLKAQGTKSGVIYCNSRNKVEELTQRLQSKGFKVAAYHAGLMTRDREWAQESFQRDDIQIIVATVAFGMGINKSNIRFVIHHDIPRSIESYYQETGRAGRDGLKAEALLLYDSADVNWLTQCIQEKPDQARKEIELHKLREMEGFAQSQTCRRLVLLHYFGEVRHENCGYCDICLDPPQQYDALLDAQKVLSAIYRTGQAFGAKYVVEVLRGVVSKKTQQYGHQQLSIYGIGKEQTEEYWLLIIRQLIHRGILTYSLTMQRILKLTEQARPILRAEQSLKLAIPRSPLIKLKQGHSLKKISSTLERDLFVKLRRLRKQLADEEDVPPYIVFTDVTLLELVQKMPTTQSGLLQISGIGQRKLERYGQAILNEITHYILQDGSAH